MPEVRLLVPIDEHHVDEILDVDDETATAWRAAGKASLVSDEQAQADQPGHYTDVVGRDDVAPLTPGASQPGPQTEDKDDEDDKPRGRKGKK